MSTNQKLAGKTAIVTGASKGIGASIALHLAKEGASVVVNYASSKEGADNVVNQITAAGGKALAVKADVSNAEEIKGLFSATRSAFGQVDILVNNAGVFEFLPLEEITEDHFHRQFNLNVLGLLLTTREALKHFNPAGGSVINISSSASTYAPPGGSVYSATKGAVDTITKSLGKELGSRKIRVNSINPGMVETEGALAGGFVGPDSELRKLMEATSPTGRIGQPSDIATAAVFLASEDSSWITGEILFVSGGVH